MLKRHPNLTIILTLALLLVAPAPSRAQDSGGAQPAASEYQLSGPFLDYWVTNGGLDRFGYPLTDVIYDPTLGLDVQYVERGRLELHHSDAGDVVMLGRVGAELIAAEHCDFPLYPFIRCHNRLAQHHDEHRCAATRAYAIRPYSCFIRLSVVTIRWLNDPLAQQSAG